MEKKLKVLMVGTAESSGGGITSVIKLIKEMPVWNKYRIYWLETQTQSNLLHKLYLALKSAFLSPFIIWKYDIIHFHMVPGITLLTQLPELLIAKLYRKRVIVEVHVGNQLVPYAKDGFFRWWFKQADLVLLLAQKWVDLFKETYTDVKTPVEVLYNACEMHEYIPFEEKKKEILFAGTIHDNKAPDLLLKAWYKLKRKYPDWRLSFLGDGDVSYYQKMAEDLNLQDCVEFTGYIKGAEKSLRFHNASIYCMCSYLEGFPMVVLEAWAHSVAVVTTPVGGLPDVIKEGDNCLTFPFGDSDKLAEQLDLLISDTNLRKEISVHGYETAQKNFSINIINSRIDDIYQNI